MGNEIRNSGIANVSLFRCRAIRRDRVDTNRLDTQRLAAGKQGTTDETFGSREEKTQDKLP